MKLLPRLMVIAAMAVQLYSCSVIENLPCMDLKVIIILLVPVRKAFWRSMQI